MKIKAKKTLAMVLMFALCFSLLGAHAAAAGEKAVVELGTVSGKVGSEVTLNVNLTKNPGLVSLSLNIAYDATKVELVTKKVNIDGEDIDMPKVENGTVLGGDFTTSKTGDANPLLLMWVDGAATANNTKTGTIAKISFKILAPCEESPATITLTYNADDTFATNPDDYYDFPAVEVEVKNGEISVGSGALRGDVDGNGKVTMKDLGILQKYFAGFSWADQGVATPDMNAVDISGDGKITMKDLGMLQKYFAGFSWADQGLE